MNEETGLVRFALAYINAGLSVLPLNNNRIPDAQRLPLLYDSDGNPVLNRRGNHKHGWSEFQERIPTEDEARNWFATDSGCIGLVCGAVSGGLFVMDFDYESESVFPLWVESISNLNLDLTVIKTGKGYHVYLRCPDGVPGNTVLARNDQNKILIETKGEGGCITTIPSIHPIGRRYKLETGSLLTIPVITVEQRDVLLDAARAFNKHIVYTPKVFPDLLHPAQVSDKRVERYINVVLASVTDDLAQLEHGNRNNELFRAAARLGGFIAGNLVNYDNVYRNLERACVSNGLIADDGYHSFEATVDSGIQSGSTEPITESNVKSRLYFKDDYGSLPRKLREIAPAITADEIAEVSHIVRRIEKNAYWRGYHDGMEIEHREHWELLVPREAIDMFELGWNSELQALSVPFPNPRGEIVNIEYHKTGQKTYEQDVMPSFFHALSPILGNRWDENAPTVLFSDAINAMWGYLKFGHLELDGRPLQFAALPQYRLSSDAIDFLNVDAKIFLIASGKGMQSRGVKALLPYVSVTRLAQPFSRMVTHIRDHDFMRWLKTGVSAVGA